MPRLRKGKIPESSRHVRRLARIQSALDLRDVRSACTSTEENSTPLDNEVMQQLNYNINITSTSQIADQMQNIQHYTSFLEKDRAEESSLTQENDVEDREPYDHENYSQVHFEDNDMENDSYSSYRYSDSEAESIPMYDSDCDGKCEHIEDDLFDYYTTKDEKFKNAISEWAKIFKISHNALKDLLSILNANTDTRFPKDPRTILATPKSTAVVTMGHGEYCHVGLENAIKSIISIRTTYNLPINKIKLLINIDGAPITGNSSEKGMWPILCKDSELPNLYVVGIYFGPKKPEDRDEFLEQLVQESKQLIENGHTYNGKIVEICIDGFICDSPAKSFILNTKYPSGFFSCSKCTIEGTYYGAVYFPLKNLESLKLYCKERLRTDEKFRNLEYAGDYQHGETILNQLPKVGLVSSVPLDCMHLVYLGVTRQLIRHWLGNKGRMNKRYKLSDAQIKQISERLENMKYILPNDFNRRSRSLEYWKLWKATEFRHFLLYFGPFVLKDVLPLEIYNNFLMLHISISILANKTLVSDEKNIDYAESLLTYFIDNFQAIYSKENVTHNVHNLLHLANDVRKYGPLESFAAFPFENYMCSIKKLLRKSDKPLQQICRRLSEYESVRELKPNCVTNKERTFGKHHYHGVLTKNEDFHYQYKILTFNSSSIIVNDSRNNCVLLKDGTIVNILNIVKNESSSYIVGKRCIKENDLYFFKGFRSSNIGICYAIESDDVLNWPCDMVVAKIFKMICTNGFIAVPIIHTLQ